MERPQFKTMSVIFLTNDLMFSSQATSVARQQGCELAVVADLNQAISRVSTGGVSRVILDLNMPGLKIDSAVASIRCASSETLRILAYASHVHEAKLEAARSAGCDEVISRGQISREMSQRLT